MKVIFHIGTGKTGTTSVQNICALSRDALRDAGILYPRTLGRVNHEIAAVCAADFHPGFSTSKAPSVKSAEDLEDFRKEIAAQLADEIAASGCDTIFVSNEHLFEKVRRPEHFDRLMALFPPMDDVSVIGYFRHQTDFAAVIFAELVRMGSAAKRDNFLESQRSKDLLDYYGGAALWGDRFGDEKIILRPFDRKKLFEGDVVRDLFANLGMSTEPIRAQLENKDVANRRATLDDASTTFLEMFNQTVEEELKRLDRKGDIKKFKIVRHRALIVRALEAAGQSGKKFQLTAEQIERVAAEAHEGNVMLASRFGLDLPAAALHQTDGTEALDVSEAVRLFANLWINTGFPER